jgi:hypothetical protein
LSGGVIGRTKVFGVFDAPAESPTNQVGSAHPGGLAQKFARAGWSNEMNLELVYMNTFGVTPFTGSNSKQVSGVRPDAQRGSNPAESQTLRGGTGEKTGD